MEFVQEIYRKFNQAKYWAPEVDECPTGQLLAVGLSFTLYGTPSRTEALAIKAD